MSAIAGIICFDQNADPSDYCQRMLAQLVVYGRDGVARWDGARASLGICKMSVLAEDRFDRQPLVDAERGLVMVADARIDNRDQLRAALAIDRAEADAMADADFIFAAFKRWGEECLSHLLGDFAFAVYDSRAQRLFIARDPLGARPLFYHAGAGWVAFASMPAGLLALPGVTRKLDEDSLARDLLLLPLRPTHTFFADLSALPSAHAMSIRSGAARPRRYWNPADVKPQRLASDADYVTAFRGIFDEAVRCRLRGVGGIGSHLSSGLDSSSVTAIAARILAESGSRLTAFTSVPRAGHEGTVVPNHFNDEGPLAAAVAAMYPNIEHVLISAGGRSFVDRLERDQPLLGAPLRNPFNFLWLDAINEEAQRRGIRVVLSGGLGNVTISYTGLQALSELLRGGHWLALAAEARALMRTQNFSLLGVADLALGPSLPAWTRRIIQRIRREEPWAYSAVNPRLARALRLEPLSRTGFARVYSRPLLNSRAWRIFMLTSIDAGAYRLLDAAQGIDARDPTADQRVVEFCLTIPDRQVLHDGVSRRLVRRAMVGILPAVLLGERGKGLQSADWQDSMMASRQQIIEEFRWMETSEVAARIIDLPRMRALIANWPQGNLTGVQYVNYCQALPRAIGTGSFIRAQTN